MLKKKIAIISAIIMLTLIAVLVYVRQFSKIPDAGKQGMEQGAQTQIQEQTQLSSDAQIIIGEENLIADKSKWLTYRNSAYNLSFKYPDSWEVNSVSFSNLGGKRFSINSGKEQDRKLRFNIAIFDSNDSPEKWYRDRFAAPENNDGEVYESEINGNATYYVKTSRESYIDHDYVMSNGKIIILASFRQKEIFFKINKERAYASKTIEKEWDYSSYLQDFEYFVNSIKF